MGLDIDHECSACGGTGDQSQRLPSIPDRQEGRSFWRCGTCNCQNSVEDGECQFCDCAGLDCTRASCSDPRHFVPCPVCLGSGRISDRIPVADALADAETVRCIVEPYAVREIAGPIVDLYNAAACIRVLSKIQKARAVPGLREE